MASRSLANPHINVSCHDVQIWAAAIRYAHVHVYVTLSHGLDDCYMRRNGKEHTNLYTNICLVSYSYLVIVNSQYITKRGFSYSYS